MGTLEDRSKSDRVKSTCYMCYNACGIVCHTEGNKVLKIEGDPDNPQNYGKMCAKGRSGLYELDNPKRVTTPMKRTNPEKGIGIDPKWEPISWEEALTTVADRMKKIRADDPRKLLGCAFDSHVYTQFFIWLDAFGSPNGITGGADFFCGNGLHPVTELTHGSWFCEPDMDHCNYLILDGTQSGFVVNHLPMHMADAMAKARKRGMKLVVIDPICTTAGQAADEWIPIKPGTDTSFALAMGNVLLNELGIYDAEFLKNDTNAPYLIGEDGRYIRDAGTSKPMVWDEVANSAITFDMADSKSLALTGCYEVDGKPCSPSFQKIKDHLTAYSPEEASETTGIPAETIRRIAKEFGEAASIGSTIEIDGETLPLRPACMNWYKGPISHTHGFMAGFSLQMLNILVGGIDVPGGHLGSNPVGPWWEPRASEDGLIVPNDYMLGNTGMRPYPARPVKQPETTTLFELFPVAPYSGSMTYEGLLNPEKYNLPYETEMLLLCRSNPVFTTISPETVSAALKKIPFIVSLAYRIDESAEFADIVFPDAHYLERTDAFCNIPHNFHASGLGDWHFQIRQPVVEPPPGVTHWMQTLIELADRAGFKEELAEGYNHVLPLDEGFRLDGSKKFTWDEVNDNWLKSRFGEDQGLDWFKEHGFINYRKKKVEEAFARPFLKSRLPIYIEHFVDVKEDLKRVTDEMGIEWDVEDYQPIPDYRPCRKHDHVMENSGFDLIAVSCKVPFNTFGTTVGNPILDDIRDAPHMKFGLNILLNTETAKKRGLADGEEVWIETTNDIRVKAVMRVINGIHPEVIGFPGLYGRWARDLPRKARVGTHFNTLLEHGLDKIDTVAGTTDMCVRAKVYPV